MYGLSTNMGYGTEKHMKGIEQYGVISEHRRSFAPVKKSLGLPCKEEKDKKKTWIGV
jgi:ribonuclease HII